MKNIILIGAGELGSRHLQSLVNLGGNIQLTVVEPADASIELAKARVEEITANIDDSSSVNFVKSIEQLPELVDLAIVATSAAPRLEIIKSVLERSKIKYFVLEKVLFQSCSEYDEAEKMLTEAGVKTWVNCPRRMFTAYTELKSLLNQKSEISMQVTGGDWGLACNAIHFIDIFAFLTECSVMSIETDNLEQRIYPSKRDGYIEVFGALIVRFTSGHTLTLKCSHEPQPLLIELIDDSNCFAINEASGEIYNHNEITSINMAVRYQSELSEVFAEQILMSGEAQITTFKESKQLHMPFVSAFLTFYNGIQKLNSTILPIT